MPDAGAADVLPSPRLWPAPHPMTILRPILAALLLLAACSPAAETADTSASTPDAAAAVGGQEAVDDTVSQPNVVRVALGSKDHTTLVAALKAADLVSSLANAGPFTVFAPTNAAFDKLPAGTVETLLKPENKLSLKTVLHHHVTTSALDVADLTDGQSLGMVDGASDDVAWGQLGTLVEARHEARAIRQFQQGAFTAHGFGDQVGLGLGVVQAGRVELIELHVGDAAAGAPGHGNAVAGRDVGIAGVLVGLAGTTGGECDKAGAADFDLTAVLVQYIGAYDAVFAAQALLVSRDELDRHPIFHEVDMRAFPHTIDQRRRNGATGGIVGMNDAAVRVAAFARQMQMLGIIQREAHALLDQPANGLGAIFNSELDAVFMAQAGSGDQRILDMTVGGVGFVQHGCHATLCIVGTGLGQRGF